ncbi:MAG: hypothetical protein FJ267_01430, partial [Planctomycetes bacterium]|nr:hypothetical protein [Planctomycetota bacterium]
MIEFDCQCGHRFRTKSANIGQQIVCPNCLSKLIVPDCEESDPPQIKKPLPKVESKTSKPRATSSGTAPTSRSSVKPASSSNSSRPPQTPPPKRPKPKSHDDGFDDMELADVEIELSDDSEPSDSDIPITPRRRVRRSQPPDESPRSKPVENNFKKSKKKQSSREEDSPPKSNDQTKTMIAIGSSVAALLVVIVLGVALGPSALNSMKNAGKIKVPQELDHFKTDDFPFTCQYPKGWEPVSGGGTANVPPSVRFEKGNVMISFRASLSGTLIGDISGAGRENESELPDELKAVAQVHEFQKQKISLEMTNCIEKGPPEKIITGL